MLLASQSHRHGCFSFSPSDLISSAEAERRAIIWFKILTQAFRFPSTTARGRRARLPGWFEAFEFLRFTSPHKTMTTTTTVPKKCYICCALHRTIKQAIKSYFDIQGNAVCWRVRFMCADGLQFCAFFYGTILLKYELISTCYFCA